MQSLGGQAFVALLAADRSQHIVEGVLHILQIFFLGNKAQLFLLHRRLFQRNGRFEFNAFVHFGLLLLVKNAVGNVKPLQRCLGQLNAHLFVILLYLKIFLRFFSLALQTFQLVVYLKQQVFNTGKVLLGEVKL